MSSIKLAEKNFEKDRDFAKAMHGESFKKRGLGALMSKSGKASDVATEGYFKHWDGLFQLDRSLLQLGHRLLRIWLGFFLPFFPLLQGRGIQTSHCET